MPAQLLVQRLLDCRQPAVDFAVSAAALPPGALIARRHTGVDQFDQIQCGHQIVKGFFPKVCCKAASAFDSPVDGDDPDPRELAQNLGPVDKVAQEASMWYNKHEEG